jgi:hypothetical protein
MMSKHDVKDIKICLQELEERVLDEHNYIVRFNNLYEILDNVFSALYESLDQTNNIEYLSFVRISFNLEVPEAEKKFLRVSSVIDFKGEFKNSIFYKNKVGVFLKRLCKQNEYIRSFAYLEPSIPEKEECNKLYVELHYRNYPEDRFDKDFPIMKKIFKSYGITIKDKILYVGFVYRKKLRVEVNKCLL